MKYDYFNIVNWVASAHFLPKVIHVGVVGNWVTEHLQGALSLDNNMVSVLKDVPCRLQIHLS